ncbi:antitoxin VbhA family protein [Exiguobacterium sp. s193]|uniref:antitoxin VbhA family protein n=1 Tax=Exiguobacterium sp. s193 TaxID=2751207 RepID=UPI001BEA513B|nr:antitoxin VbhA family protein [Exiguobacterium sp. s193]
MEFISQNQREKNVRIAVGIASIDGGRPTSFTQQLLHQYEAGTLSSTQVKDKILKKYAKKHD